MRGKGGGEQRRQRRHRAVHQPGEPRLHHLQHEHAPARLLLGLPRVRREVLGTEPLRQRDVRALGGGEVAQQLADAGVGGALQGPLVEAARLELHGLGLLAHLVEAERPHQPQRLVVDEALHVLAPDQRDVLAELRAVQLDQPPAMLVLLLRHLGRRPWRRPGKSLASAHRRSRRRCADPPPRRRWRAPGSPARSARRRPSPGDPFQFRTRLILISGRGRGDVRGSPGRRAGACGDRLLVPAQVARSAAASLPTDSRCCASRPMGIGVSTTITTTTMMMPPL